MPILTSFLELAVMLKRLSDRFRRLAQGDREPSIRLTELAELTSSLQPTAHWAERLSRVRSVVGLC